LIPEDNTTIANDWHYPPHPGRMGTDGSLTGKSIMTDEGAKIDAWSGNGYYFHRPDIISRGGVAMFYVHESLHDMGIVDLYLYGYQGPDDIYMFGPTTLPMSDWAMMSQQNGNAREIIAWHKWLLGWLSEEQVYCFPLEFLTEIELSLSPATRESDGYKAVMIPVSDHKVIVVESRRAEGYSANVGAIAVGVDIDGVRQRRWLNQFGSEGLIVYTYDTAVFNGSGPARLQIPEGRASDWKMPSEPYWGNDPDSPWLAWDPDNPGNIFVEALPDPLVRLGDKVTVEGVTIELIESGESDRVRISK